MMTLFELLNASAAHHSAGRLAEAEQGYRQVLRADPQNADALHLLGLIAAGGGDLSKAVALIRRALALRPDFADAWYNLGNQYRRHGRAAEGAPPQRRAAYLTPTPYYRQSAGSACAEAAAAAVGGLGVLNDAFQEIHLRNRAQPDWRPDTLTQRLGPEGKQSVLALAAQALDFAPANGSVVYLCALLAAADGDLEGALAALERPTDGDNPDFARLAAQVSWYLRRPEAARANYHEFIRRKCQGDAPLRPLLTEVTEADSFRRRPRLPANRPVLIYTHYGNPDYLHYSIGQNLISNPSAHIVLIGDRENRIDGVEHRLIHDYAGQSREIVGMYNHDSDNAYCYELFCIARWFIFLDLCRREGFEEMFFLDSDYMLFCDLNIEVARWRETGAAFSLNSAHFSYFTIDRLTELCEHIRGVFLGGEDTRSFFSRNHSSLFSDMAFIYDYQRDHPFVNLCTVRDGSFFDYSITNADGFRTVDGIKDIWFENGVPFGLYEETGQPVRFKGVHFQGNSKPLMREAFHRRAWGKSAPGKN